MAAGEDQLEALVGEWGGVHRILLGLGRLEQSGLLGQGAVTANAVDGPVARGRNQPGVGAGGDAVARPALGGDRERLLRRFLGEVEIAEEADEGSEDASPLIAEGLLVDR